jgi:hypothetical protein
MSQEYCLLNCYLKFSCGTILLYILIHYHIFSMIMTKYFHNLLNILWNYSPHIMIISATILVTVNMLGNILWLCNYCISIILASSTINRSFYCSVLIHHKYKFLFHNLTFSSCNFLKLTCKRKSYHNMKGRCVLWNNSENKLLVAISERWP